MRKETPSELFEKYVLNNHLVTHPKIHEKLTVLIDKALIDSISVNCEDIRTHSNLSLNEYMAEIEQIIQNPNEAIETFTELGGIAGIETPDSVIYVKNINERELELVTFKEFPSPDGHLCHLLYSGKVTLLKNLAGLDEKTGLQTSPQNAYQERNLCLSAYPDFYGVFNPDGKFVKLNGSYEDQIKDNMTVDLQQYLEEENFLRNEPVLFN